MIKRLQKQFILVAVSAVTVVMLLVLGVVLTTAYTRVGREADRLLAAIADNDGQFPKGRPGRQADQTPAQTETPAQGANDEASRADAVPKRLVEKGGGVSMWGEDPHFKTMKQFVAVRYKHRLRAASFSPYTR